MDQTFTVRELAMPARDPDVASKVPIMSHVIDSGYEFDVIGVGHDETMDGSKRTITLMGTKLLPTMCRKAPCFS